MVPICRPRQWLCVTECKNVEWLRYVVYVVLNSELISNEHHAEWQLRLSYEFEWQTWDVRAEDVFHKSLPKRRSIEWQTCRYDACRNSCPAATFGECTCELTGFALSCTRFMVHPSALQPSHSRSCMALIYRPRKDERLSWLCCRILHDSLLIISATDVVNFACRLNDVNLLQATTSYLKFYPDWFQNTLDTRRAK